MAETSIRQAGGGDAEAIARIVRESWGSTLVVSRGEPHEVGGLPALVAVDGEEIAGVATLWPDGEGCELLTLDAVVRNRGIGSALLEAAADWARARGCRRLWLITTNDNIDAIRFYQRRGMRLVAVHRDGVEVARRIKPSIPEVGEHGIPIRDELEFEFRLGGPGAGR